LIKGEEKPLTTTLETESAGEDVEILWVSSKKAIAEVDGNGVVTVKKAETATI
jgi:hypothetical protein